MNHAEALLKKISTRQARVAVIGLGYVGLPLAVEKAKAGFTVVGIDHKADRVAQVTEERTTQATRPVLQHPSPPTANALFPHATSHVLQAGGSRTTGRVPPCAHAVGQKTRGSTLLQFFEDVVRKRLLDLAMPGDGLTRPVFGFWYQSCRAPWRMRMQPFFSIPRIRSCRFMQCAVRPGAGPRGFGRSRALDGGL